jgi:excisionase family DNA binding protein
VGVPTAGLPRLTRLLRLERHMKPALSTSEAARWLGISKSTLIRAVNRGEIQPAFRTPGRHLRFTPDSLREIRRQLEAPVREAV